MSDEERLVRQVVCLQRSSPNFATYCVSHVTDARHSFLYSNANSFSRRRYLHLLSAAQHDSRPREKSHDGPAESALGASETYNTMAMPGGLIRSPASSLQHAATPRDSRRDIVRRVVTAHNVRSIWCGLRIQAHSQRVSRRHGACTEDKAVQLRRMCGPHAPRLFHDKAELQHFLHALLHAAAYKSREGVTTTVHYMLHHLTMTNTFLYVLVYVIQELLSLYLDDVLGLHSAPCEEGSLASPGQATMQTTRKDQCLPYVEAAGTVFFALTMLLAEQCAREARMHDEGTFSEGAGAVEQHVFYYQEVFEYWLLELSRMVAEALSKYPPLRSTVLFAYMTETIEVWQREHCLSACVVDHINHLLSI